MERVNPTTAEYYNKSGMTDPLCPETTVPTGEPGRPPQTEPSVPPKEIKIDRGVVSCTIDGKNTNLELFTMTLDGETIDLVPGRNWSQLDQHKWTAKGKLPAQPAGLEIGLDHVRVAGQTVALNDAEGPAKLEQAFNDWLLSERETARKKAAPAPLWTVQEQTPAQNSQELRFQVEVDKRGQVHVHCFQDKEKLASIGLTLAGFNSLFQQGYMRKPQAMHIGALHDWVELDGELCSFEKGKSDGGRLERLLNERYVPASAGNSGKNVSIVLNPASPTGFDIQFPAMVGGLKGNHRHHLNEQALELLQDQEHCGLLHREIIIKLIPPNLVFKRRTAEGGEQYFVRSAESTVALTDADGQDKTVDLSQPLNFLRLSAPELSAVFNHPIINRHAKATPTPRPDGEVGSTNSPPAPSPSKTPVAPAAPGPARQSPAPENRQPGIGTSVVPSAAPAQAAAAGATASKLVENKTVELSAPAGETPKPAEGAKPLPNLWLNEVLAHSMVRHEWLAPLAYRKLAKWLGNSSEGTFANRACWFISLGAVEDISAPDFKGIFLYEKGGLGFLSPGQILRFNNGAAYIGPPPSPMEGLGVNLIALGLDAQNRVVFITADKYDTKFDIPEATLTELINRLSDAGAVMMSLIQTMANRDAIEVVWSLPTEQADPNNPQVLENRRPTS